MPTTTLVDQMDIFFTKLLCQPQSASKKRIHSQRNRRLILTSLWVDHGEDYATDGGKTLELK
jgi:hypothetical protein